MASETERAILDQDILRPVGKTELRRRVEHDLTGFLARRGNRYNGKLMVVGRAANGGWGSIFWCELADPAARKKHVQDIATSDNDGACPMQWIADDWENPQKGKYNPRTSAFWRVIRQVVEGLDIAEKNCPFWPSYLVWSNLYKVSPAEGWNPGVRLRRVQREGCKKLLEHEIKTYEPIRLLFLTDWEGKDWAEAFLDFLPEGDIQPFDDKGFVKASGFTRVCAPDTQTRVVVAVHPARKPGDEWVNEVVAEFKK